MTPRHGTKFGNMVFFINSTRARITFLVGLIFFLLCDFSFGAPPEEAFSLNAIPVSEDRKVQLQIPSNGIVPITLVYSKDLKDLPDLVDLDLLPFRNDHGELLDVSIVFPHDPTQPKSQRQHETPLTDIFLPLELHVEQPPIQDEYIGFLVARTVSHGSEKFEIALTSPEKKKPPQIQLEREAVNIVITKPPCWWMGEECLEEIEIQECNVEKSQENIPPKMECAFDQSRPITIAIRGKSGVSPINGLSVSLLEVTKAPDSGFDLSRNMSFWVNGDPIEGKVLMTGQTPTLPMGGQTALQLGFKNLEAGEYIVKLGFLAENIKAEDSPHLSMTIRVRDSPWSAVLVLLIATIFSFLGTQFVSHQRKRMELIRKISGLSPPWLPGWLVKSPLRPAIWVSAVFRQARDLLRNVWLGAPEVIKKRINDISPTMKILSKIRDAQEAIELSGISKELKDHQNWELDEVASLVKDEVIDGATSENIIEKINLILANLESNKIHVSYAKRLKSLMNLTLNRIHSSEIPETIVDPLNSSVNQRIIFSNLVDKIKKNRDKLNKELVKTKPSLDLGDLISMERDRYRIEVLWSRRKESDKLTELFKDCRENPDAYDSFLEKADDQVWAHLRGLVQDKRIKIRGPNQHGVNPLTNYTPYKFYLEVKGDEFLKLTNIYNHSNYYWEFEIKKETLIWKIVEKISSKVSKARTKTATLKPISRGPIISQYAPWPGTLKASVKIKDKMNKEITLADWENDGDSEIWTIEKSTEFAWLKSLRKTEYLATGAAWVVAVVSGLSTFYFSQPSFGSITDYVSLFIWGAGVDQGKNLLETLQTYSNSSDDAS